MTALEALSSPHPARLSAKDFLLLAQAGAFADYARAELIEGEIVVVNAQFRRHAAVRHQLARAFGDALAARSDGLGVLDECSVAFDDASIPQPDIVVTSEPDGDGPIPVASVRLIVEVADTTLAEDLGRKHRLYARHAIPEYWVVDLKARRVVRMWTPEAGRYAHGDERALKGQMACATISGLSVEIDRLK